MAKSKKSEGMSLRTMTLLIAIVVAILLWGAAAAMYDVANGGRWIVGPADGAPVVRRPSPIGMLIASVMAFVANSVMYLPSMPWVIGFILTKRLWFAIVAVLAEAGVIGFGIWMASLQKKLDSGQAFKTKRQERMLATPKFDDE